MSIIPIYIKPYEDELIYSWIHRLAKINEISVENLLTAYTSKKSTKVDSLGYDMNSVLPEIVENIRTKVDIKELLISHSTFNFHSKMMEPAYQKRCINAILRKPSPTNTSINNLIDKIRYCPECMKEDTSPYLHTAHHVTDVKVCYKHGCALQEYKHRSKGKEFSFDSNYYSECENVNDSELAYAQYAYQLNKNETTSDLSDIHKLLQSKIKEAGYTPQNNYQTLHEDMMKWQHAALVDFEIADFLNKRLSHGYYFDTKHLVTLLMYFFSDVQDLLNELKGAPIISTYRCSECGYEYIATEISQKHGWGCPKCAESINPHEYIENIVHTMTDGEYEMVGKFESMDKKVEFHHKSCDAYFSTLPRSFIFDSVRCSCQRRVIVDEARKIINNDGRFKLIKFVSTNQPVTIQHKKCGCICDYTYSHFISSFRCKQCDSALGSTMTPKMFAARVEALVGDEYEIVKGFVNQDTKIVLKHMNCGKEQEFWPHAFLDGQRCRYCHKQMTPIQLSQLLQQYSKGRYVITKHINTLYEIKDTQTNETIKLPPLKIRQEIMRPTPSDILPVDNRCDVEIFDAWDIGFNYLIQYKKQNGHISVAKYEHYMKYALGHWCNRQRRAYANGTLKPLRQKKLEDVGFDFDPLETEWNRRYEQYQRYIKEKGTADISRRTDFEGEHLGAWVETQRKMHKNDKMSQERIDKLKILNPEIFD